MASALDFDLAHKRQVVIAGARGAADTRDLLRLVKRYGYDARVIGTLHGRRLAHLRRDRKTGESVLTGRGQEIAQQHIFAMRLGGGSRGTTGLR